MAYGELIDKNILQRLQDEFCRVTGVYAYCLDGDKNKLTKMSGDKENLELAFRYIGSGQIVRLIERVEDGSLEDVAVEYLEDGQGIVASVSVKIRQKVQLYWVVVDLTDESAASMERLTDVLDMLRDASSSFLMSKYEYFNAEAESRRNQTQQLRLVQNMENAEATAEIVQLLDCDDAIEEVMEKWLKILSGYLKCYSAHVFRLHDDERFMDVVCEWKEQSKVSFFDSTNHVESYSFLYSDKPVVVSKENVDGRKAAELEKVGISAVMVYPLYAQDNASGRLVLAVNFKKPHTFTTTEIKFGADAVKVMQSIIARRIQRNSLAGSYASLEAVLDNVGSSIYVVDKNTGSPLFVNRRCRKIFGEEIKKGNFLDFLNKGVEQASEKHSVEVFHEASSAWFDLRFREIAWVDGRRAMMYALYDITEKKEYQERIEQLAFTDFLTGLYNRMCCEKDLARAIDEAKKAHRTGALLYLDLDDFKHINDGLGHQYGDVLLRAISHALQRVEGIHDTCYRMGGDEFVIVVSHDVYPDFDRLLEDIKQIFSKPWFLKNADYYCTMSMGIVTFPDHGDSVPELIKKSDIAMYEAKKTGKNRVAYYSDSLDSLFGRRLDMEKNMRDATVEGYGEFEVYYQPIIDVSTGENACVGAEALLRWNSSKLGFISPMEFIPLAEYLGLINPIGNYVLREACFRCKSWNDNGYPDYKVNVNLSVVQLLQPDIVQIVQSSLKDSGLSPGNLTLEVTESLAINDMERMKRILEGIKKLGVKLALDDFGTGYSSLNHVREIPIDIIKVDQSFVKGLAKDAYSQSFIKMISELAETIGVSICVEGIETPKQYKVLQGMKVKYIQGFYFDKPMPGALFELKYCPGIEH